MGHWRRTQLGGENKQRLPAEIPIRISTVDPETDPATGLTFFRSVEETTADLSSGGAFVRSWEPLAANRRVLVEIDLPGSPLPLELSARVAWTQLRVRTLERSPESRIGNTEGLGRGEIPGSSASPESTRPIDSPGYGIEFHPSNHEALRRIEAFLEGQQTVPARPGDQAPSIQSPSLFERGNEIDAPSRGRTEHPDDASSVSTHRTPPTPS